MSAGRQMKLNDRISKYQIHYLHLHHLHGHILHNLPNIALYGKNLGNPTRIKFWIEQLETFQGGASDFQSEQRFSS